MFQKMVGSFSCIAALQFYASPLTAVTTKMIQNSNLTALEGFAIVLGKERGQLSQRIVSRMVLCAGRNAIALVLADEFLAKFYAAHNEQ